MIIKLFVMIKNEVIEEYDEVKELKKLYCNYKDLAREES